MEIIYLSEAFYQDYGSCQEILKKKNRPYVCLAIKIGGDVYAIPFRHNIRHKYAFFTVGCAGLDYTKAVPIRSQSYIGKTGVQVSQVEYNAVKGREALIANGLKKYIALYKKAKKYPSNPNYSTILSCSALQYFL